MVIHTVPRRTVRPLADASLALAIVSLLLASAPAGAQPGGDARRAAQPAPACTVTETSRTPLVVDGDRELYVEPTAVLPSRGEIFLAGTPNFLYARGGPGDARDFVRDSVFGAVLGRDGHARVVPSPIDPTRVVDIRGVALDSGGWAVTFGELKNPWQPPARDTVVRYWYGVFDGKAWSRLEQLPAIPGGQMTTAAASQVLVRGDTTFFAARDLTDGKLHDIAVFERRLGKWMVTAVDTDGAAGVQLLYTDLAGLQLLIVRAVGTPGGPGDENSVFLHSGKGSWMTSRRVIQGYPEPIYHLTVADSPEGSVFTWQAALPSGRRQARAMVGSLELGGTALTLDSATNRVVYVQRPLATALWVTDHVQSRSSKELRFVVRNAGTEPIVAGAMPNPYTGFFGAAPVGPNELLISGPLLRPQPPNPSLVTLLIRARVECAGRAP